MSLTPSQQQLCIDANLTERHARAVLCVKDETQRTKLLAIAAQRHYSVQQTEELVAKSQAPRGPKPRKRVMVKDVRICLNTIDHAIKVMTGSGIPATAKKQQNDEFIEYVVRIPTGKAVRK